MIDFDQVTISEINKMLQGSKVEIEIMNKIGDKIMVIIVNLTITEVVGLIVEIERCEYYY